MAGRKSGTTVEVSAGAVRAFRLHAHHLTRRQPLDALLDVAGACGIQNSPPGSALLALHARVEGVTPGHFDALIGADKTLLQTWCMRGSPYLFPTADTPIFTTGVLPPTEKARVHLITGVDPALAELGLSLDEAVDHTAAEIDAVLSGRRLAINELGQELADRIAPKLSPAQRKTWQAPGPYAAGQPLGEGVVHFCLRILTLRGLICFAERTGNKSPFVLVSEWLGAPPPQLDPETARATLLRRYLHCYGPSTRKDFSAWVGVSTGDVEPWWNSLENELTPIEFAGNRTWIHTDDLDALTSSPPSHGLRLLPPGDPYIQSRDRETLIDKKHHGEIWKTVGAPGTILADGELAGIWRPRKTNSSLALTITTFRPLKPALRKQLRAEAEQLAELRGAKTVQVVTS